MAREACAPLPEGDEPGRNEVGDLIRGPWPELVDLDALTATDEQAPVVVDHCRCGNVTVRGHNSFTCDEVLAIRARVDADIARERVPENAAARFVRDFRVPLAVGAGIVLVPLVLAWLVGAWLVAVGVGWPW